jgi:ubiquinol-cytochrome c reductase iron-sulfur subunit
MAQQTPPAPSDQSSPDSSPVDSSKRDFLAYATTAMALTGTALALWPMIDSMNPAADILAMASTDVDLAPIQVGQRITVTWRGKPVFIAYRTPQEIAAASDVVIADLRDPEADAKRVQQAPWLIVVGICTHLGCIPLGQKPTDPRGAWGGWFCPCHGSHYDTAARIRKGPAPRNLAVPPYTFTKADSLRIG